MRRIWLLVAPIAIAAIGALWIVLALQHYERATGRRLQGIIGYHYSGPQWGFTYAPGGPHIEWWSFDVPAAATFALFFVSVIFATVKWWRAIGAWGTVGLWLYHLFWAGAFGVVYVVLWAEAASVFI